MSQLRRDVPPSMVLLAVMSVVAGSSLVSVVRGPGLWFAAVLGAAVALVAMVIGRRFSLLTLEWVALSILLATLLGGVACGPVPSPTSYRNFFSGLIGGWADLLSSVPPVDAAGEVLALPFVLAWLSGTVGAVLVRHVRVAIIGALGPAIAFGVGLLFSVELRNLALVQGSVMVALSLALGWYQQRQLGFEVDEEIGNTTVARRRARLMYAGAVLLAIGISAPLIAPLVPGLDGRERFDLREWLEPPWDPLDEPSPLAQIKSNYAEDVRNDVVFVVRGEGLPQRWALATLASFDGTTWSVGDAEIGGLAPFVPIDGSTPAELVPPIEARSLVEAEVEIRNLEGPWLPLPGWAEQIALSPETEGSLRFNARTGTAAIPTGSNAALYTVRARPWPALDRETLSSLTYSSPTELGIEGQAGAVRSWSADIVEGADFGWAQIERVQEELSVGGYSVEERVRPGHSWSRLESFFQTESLVGNEEQYAAVAGIAARNAGLHARVVVGYLIPADELGKNEIAVARTNASAWIEVLTVERGWVPVDVTPDRDNEPSFEESGTRTESVAAPNPPPSIPPPPEQEVAPEEELEEEDKKAKEDEPDGDAGIPAYVIGGLIAVGLPMVLVGGWLVLLTSLKALRRQRRRKAATADRRVAGAWFEAADRLSEFGVAAPENSSIHEFAGYAERSVSSAVGLRELADLADQSAFAPPQENEERAAAAWERSDAIVARVRRSRTRRERLRVLGNPSSLRRRDPS